MKSVPKPQLEVVKEIVVSKSNMEKLKMSKIKSTPKPPLEIVKEA